MGQLVGGAPGVYLRAIPSEPALQLSAVAGFVGVAERGPLHRPEPIQSWEEYLTVFGQAVDYAFLPDAVLGFFRNGGQKCFVVRVADTSDRVNENPAKYCPRIDPLLCASHKVYADDDSETINIAAINEGRWGNDIGYEIARGTQDNMLLTTLKAAADADADHLAVVYPFDLAKDMEVLLAPPGDPFGTIYAEIATVDATGQVTLKSRLPVQLPLGTQVLGRGFKLIVRFDGQTEIFDNLSMSLTHARYFADVVNGSDDTLSYIERRAAGCSILVRVSPVDNHSEFRPEVTTGNLSGGGNGSSYDAATLKDSAGNDSITLVARVAPEELEPARSQFRSVRVRTALAANARAQNIVVEDSSELAPGDSLTVPDPVNPAQAQTFLIADVAASTNIVALSAPLTNPHPVRTTVTVQPRRAGTIRVRATPFEMRLALAAAGEASTIVVENADGLVDGDDLALVIDPSDETLMETCEIASVDTTTNEVTLKKPLYKLHAVEATVAAQGRFALSVFLGTTVEPAEVHRNLSVERSSPRYFRNVLVSNKSMLVCGEDVDDAAPNPPVGEATLIGGRSPGSIESHWFTGYDGDAYFVPAGTPDTERFGLAALETEEEIDLVAVPDLAGQMLFSSSRSGAPSAPYVQSCLQVLHHAAKCGDRFALIDTQSDTLPVEAASLSRQISDPLTGRFGALYYPWLSIATGEAPRLVPPSGFIAGVIARADQDAGVSRAPANYPVKEAVDLETLLDQANQDDLNPASVNCIRKFEKPAIELWGTRTLSPDPAARYVNAQRLVIAVKKALARSLRWTVFEPNGPVLWRRIQANLQSLMQTLVAGGATAAASAKESFFVKCDPETNPPEVIGAGQVIAIVGIALTAPAEFILLNVKQTPAGVTVSEQD